MNREEQIGYDLYVHGGRVFSDDNPSTIAGWLQAQIDSEMVYGHTCAEEVIEQCGPAMFDASPITKGWNNEQYEWPDEHNRIDDDANRLECDFRETTVVVREHWSPGITERLSELLKPQPATVRLHAKHPVVATVFPADQRRERAWRIDNPGVESDRLQEKELVPTQPA